MWTLLEPGALSLVNTQTGVKPVQGPLALLEEFLGVDTPVQAPPAGVDQGRGACAIPTG